MLVISLIGTARTGVGLRRPPAKEPVIATQNNLTGRVALVTGSTSGIGEATAKHLAADGARVIVVGRNLERGARVVETIRDAGGQADFLVADLVDGMSARDLAARALDLVGRVDILVSNAAAGGFGSTQDFAEADFDRIVGTNLKAPFYLVGALAPKMVEHGSGAIVCVSSMGGQMGIAGLSVYGGTKAGMDLISRSWAAEYGPHGVRVNTVSPGLTATPSAMADPAMMDRARDQVLLGRAAQPEQVAAAIVFLASDAAGHINGVVLNVDGGRRM